jgi:predicted metalloprotease
LEVATMSSLIRAARKAGIALLFAGTAIAARPADVTITEADVAESNNKIREAYGALRTMWEQDFSQMGRQFVAPRIYNYRGNVRTSCGVMTMNNAAYCPSNNAIYFDEVFVTRQRKEAAQQLGTDGDMAGIGVIAHEMGHAAAMQLGYASRTSYDNEAVADCLAGTFVGRVQQDTTLGRLDPGDIEEALAGVAAAGDPAVELTGNSRVDARRAAMLRRMSHGTSEQRVSNFKVGLSKGIRGCL